MSIVVHSLTAASGSVDAELCGNRPDLNGRGCVSTVAQTADSADSGTSDESAEHDAFSVLDRAREMLMARRDVLLAELNRIDVALGGKPIPQRRAHGTLAAQILDFVRTNPGCRSSDIRSAIGGSAGSFSSLVSRGDVVRVSKGTRDGRYFLREQVPAKGASK